MDARAVEAHVDAIVDRGPCGILCVAIKAHAVLRPHAVLVDDGLVVIHLFNGVKRRDEQSGEGRGEERRGEEGRGEASGGQQDCFWSHGQNARATREEASMTGHPRALFQQKFTADQGKNTWAREWGFDEAIGRGN